MPYFSPTCRSGLIAAALLLTACTNVQFGQDFDLAHFKTHIQRGETTQQQIQAWLGPPASTGTVVEADGEQFERWLYYHGAGKLTRMQEADMKTLEIQFDADNVVQSYNWTGQ